MRKVKNKKQLIEALDAGEKEVILEGKLFILKCRLASKFIHRNNIIKNDIGFAAVSLAGTEIVIIVVAVIVGVIAIIAIFKERSMTMETSYDPTTGKWKGRFQIQ